LGLARAAASEAEGSNSRYEEPEAVGMRPVLRTYTFMVSGSNLQLQGKRSMATYRFSVARKVVAGAEHGLWHSCQIVGLKQKLLALCHLVAH
jgi:hypothetical protein